MPTALKLLYLTSSFLANVSRPTMGVASQESPPPLLSSSARGLSIARLLWSILSPRAALGGGGGRQRAWGLHSRKGRSGKHEWNGSCALRGTDGRADGRTDADGRITRSQPTALITGFSNDICHFTTCQCNIVMLLAFKECGLLQHAQREN